MNKEHKCDECKYEYLSKEEHPCSVCRWRFKGRKLVVLGNINYFEPKEEKGLNECKRCKYEHDSAIDEPCVNCSKSTNYFEPKEYDEVDMVNHPPHYQHGIEPIEFIESHNLNFNLGSAVKYIARAPYKGKELEDLKKAKWFIEREIKRHDK